MAVVLPDPYRYAPARPPRTVEEVAAAANEALRVNEAAQDPDWGDA